MKTINKETYSLLEDLSKEPFFEKHSATLIGGTALAYHYNHRESFDIDICFPHNSNLPPLPFLEKYNLEKNEFDNFVKDTAINEGGDIDTQIQRYIQKDTGLKVDFVVNVGSNIYESEILKKDLKSTKFNNITIASPEAIFKLKSLLILDRNKIRDLYDVVYLTTKENFKPQAIIDTIQEFRITYTYKDIERLISSKKPNMLDVLNEPISLPKIQNLTEYNTLKTTLLKALQKEFTLNESKTKDPLIKKVEAFCKNRDAKQKAPEKYQGMER